MTITSDYPRGKLILSDGARFDGYLIAPGALPLRGETVFNTSMTGYQEVITDPSYAGQFIVMTYPQIGNYGVSLEDSERATCAARALIVRELSPYYSPAPGRSSLQTFLQDRGLPCLAGVDTRALTLHIRSMGSTIGVIARAEEADDELVQYARKQAYSTGESLVASVTCARAGEASMIEPPGVERVPLFESSSPGSSVSFSHSRREGRVAPASNSHPRGRAAVIDLGIKKSILEHIEALGIQPVVFDMRFRAEEILTGGFDFVVLSNGPGDPADVPEVIAKVKTLLGNIPILGICLGHQITALAMGGTTYKMKFGHRGANQPVICTRTGRVFITSQNHGYAVASELEHATNTHITFMNANDGTIEGFSDPGRMIECIQFHPEASPGPRDTEHLFADFVLKVKGGRNAAVV